MNNVNDNFRINFPISYFSTKSYVLGTQKNIETVLMSTKNIDFNRWENDLNFMLKRFIYLDQNFCLFFSDARWAKVVYHARDDRDLWNWENIINMCDLEVRYISSHIKYQKYCAKSTNNYHCCKPLSLGNYIALLTGRESCFNITREDVQWVKQLLEECVSFYHNHSISHSCDRKHSPYNEREKCKGVPKKCVQYNAVYNIIHFISDHSFMKSSKSLYHAISYLPISFLTGTSEQLSDAISLYIDIEESLQLVGNVEIVAIDFGIKNHLFQHYLQRDSKWLIVGAIAILMVVWLFTSSIFITIMTFLAMFWSLELGYFLYVFVFEVPFFPYMNLVTVLLILALGSDDVFIYTKIWHLAKRDRNSGTLEKLVSDTLKHATLSMIVTSLTTAGALFANIVSPITTIKCFSVYSGTVVLCNLVFMVTWTPAVIVIQEKWCDCCCINSPKIYKRFRSHYRSFFERLLPHFVIRLRYLWIILFGGLGVTCGFLVFHYPKLRLPTSFRFQVFRQEHLMEVYDQKLKDNFWFEKSINDDKPYMPLTFVWGVVQTDTGNQFDPYDKGSLELDTSFNPNTPHAQVWLRRFCQQLRKTDFYKKVTHIEYNNCFIEHFILYMKRSCLAGETTCCNKRSFPYPENLYSICIKKYIPFAIQQNIYFWDKYTPGLRFVNNEVKSLIVQFSSNFVHADNYELMRHFYNRVNDWFLAQLASAPMEIQNGWFISEFRYYSLQASLASGMPVAFGISLLVAGVVTFFTSLNVLITLYAILSIGGIMLVTTGAIVLMGWELNVLESVIITVAVGLSIDHTLHYGVAYRLAPDLDRHNRALSSLKTVGSVICVASLTTFLAGVFMLASVTLVYQKFGIFLILVISISWLYSTFFFQSLLNVIGPQGGFGQFHWPSLDCCNVYPRNHVDRTTYSVSESTMSSLSSGYPHHASVDIDKDVESEKLSLDSPYPRSRQVRQWRGGGSSDIQTNEKLLNGEENKNKDIKDMCDNKQAQRCTEV